MDLDEWYDGVQRWRTPPAQSRWRRVPKVAAVALGALALAIGAAQLGGGRSESTAQPTARSSTSSSPAGLPVVDVPTTMTTLVTTTHTTTAGPTTLPPTTVVPAAPAAPIAPTTRLSAAASTPPAPNTTARTAPAPTTAAPPPPTTAAPPPTTAAPPPPAPEGGPAPHTGRLNAGMGVSRSPVPAGQPVTFSASWSDSNGQLASMGIEFGDGGRDHRNGGPCGPGSAGPRSGGESFTHTFARPGTYTVRLHVHTDDCTGGRQGTVVTLTLRVT